MSADYIYGYRTSEGTLVARTDTTEEEARRLARNPVRIPVSAIEPLPEPKPVLPTTPGSVVQIGIHFYVLEGVAWSGHISIYSLEEVARMDWSLVFDAGAHDEGKSE